MSDSGKIPLVLFSGGLDSTYLLDQTLRFQNCDVLYVSGVQGDSKVDKETLARKGIVKIINEHRVNKQQEYVGEIQKFYEFKLDQDLSVVSGEFDFITGRAPIHAQMYSKQRFQQVLPWLYSIANVIDPRRHSCVSIGYVQGDSVNPQLGHIVDLWNKICQIIFGTTIAMEFPLVYHGKEKLAMELHPKLFASTWHCEGQNNEPCGVCQPCFAFAKMIFGIEYRNLHFREYKGGFLGFIDDRINDRIPNPFSEGKIETISGIK